MIGAAKQNGVDAVDKEGSIEGSVEWEKVDDADDRDLSPAK